MKLAFCLYKYFPYGGLQRDFLRIALACKARAHHIRIYTLSWQGTIPDGLEIIIVPAKGLTNHTRNQRYHHWVMIHLNMHPVDRIIGFNKMPGLDFYYAADTCYAEEKQKKSFLYKLTARYKHYIKYETAVFNANNNTQLLMLTEKQMQNFIKHYHTERKRFHLLPPGIDINRRKTPEAKNIREKFRQENHIRDDVYLIIQIGSDFKRKGVERSLLAIAALPENIRKNALYFAVGHDNPADYIKIATKLGIAENVKFYSGRDDIPAFLFAADLLLHPAHSEAAGMVLLEALTSGLPVISTDICGYAYHISQANAGIIIESPFTQAALNHALCSALVDRKQLSLWSEHALLYADTTDMYSLPEKAADLILADQDD